MNSDVSSDAKPSRNRVRSSCLAILCGALLTFVLALAVISIIARRGQLPKLDRSRFEAAWAAWAENSPPNYNITIEVTGRQAAVYSAQVRDAQAIAATRNGAPLQQQRTLRTWSVPGMFDTIESDIETVEAVAAGTARRGTPKLSLRAEFHPHWKYPSRYQRIEWGSPHEVTWEVVEFEIIADTATTSP